MCFVLTWAIIEKVRVKIGGPTKWIIDVWTVVFANVADTPERRVNPKCCNNYYIFRQS